jgi:hypothetical protein
MRTTRAIVRSAAERGPYTVIMAAKPVRRRRMPGSWRKPPWSHTPERTEGSLSSSSTAATPPTNRTTGLANTCQAMPSLGASAGSPAGWLKSKAMPGGGRSSSLIDSSIGPPW